MKLSLGLAAALAVLLDAALLAAAPAERGTVTTFALGPTAFGEMGPGSGAGLWRPGLVLESSTRWPLGDSAGIGTRVAWGLTEWDRFTAFTDAGYAIGRWTTHAYRDVWRFASADTEQPFRAMGGFFGFAFLLFPYMLAGTAYVLAPFATTTYLELDVTGSYEFADASAEVVPYLGAGVGFAAWLHPRTDEPYGGLGPTLAVGLRFERLDLALKSTWFPPYAHGEAGSGLTSVVTSALTVGFHD